MKKAAHLPVMLKEVIAALDPQDGGVYVDATLGDGGYTRAILGAANCTVIAFDRDPRAIAAAAAWARDYGDRLRLINRPFAEMADALGDDGLEIDGVVFDLGVSSMQLDEADRGFSFRFDGPLSMRMDGGKPDASDVVANAAANDLKLIFKAYGEEKNAAKIARAIVAAREVEPIETTGALAAIVEKANPPRGAQKIHPATRVFQALRIFVNDELGQLAEGLSACERLLRAGGRMVVVSFHSLEDRIVKRFLSVRSATRSDGSRHAPPTEIAPPVFSLPVRGAKTPSEEECAANPRARSAKLRAAIRTANPLVSFDRALLGLPTVSVSISD
ncbi:MAG: 16S rRNA (cytosine(1402)-N(4))-methyltransferase RsmH [Pseudomonadota bacterium]